MQVRDVEHSLRRIVSSAFRRADREIDELARRSAIEEITASNRTLRRKFSAAVQQYLSDSSRTESTIVGKWLDAAFLELLGCDQTLAPDAQTGSPRTQRDVPDRIRENANTSLNLSGLFNSARILRTRLELALQSYLLQQSMNAGPPDEQLLDQAFTILYKRREEVKDFNQLTLAEYIQLFFTDSCWGRCKSVIKLQQQELKHMLVS